jgi:CheY-like chemotaxis protein
MARRQLRVLLVDDDPLVRLAVDRQLEVLGCSVLAVNNGAEAIAVLTKGMRFDVLVTDLNLPDRDGRSIAWTAAALSPRMRMVFMSGSAPGEPLEPADAPFLLKPFSTAALANALAGAVPLDEAGPTRH